MTVPAETSASTAPWTRAAIGTAALVFCTMAANFTPTPLYPRYQETWSLSAPQVSLIFSIYAVGVLAVLVPLGGISDRIGRLRTLRWAACLVLSALCLLAFAHTYEQLLLGRLLQGMGTGVVASAGAAALLDLHPRGPQAGSLQFTLVISGGITVGPILSGLIASNLPHPLTTPYLLAATLTAVATSVLLTASIPNPAARAGRVVQTIRVPRALWRSFAPAATAIISTNVAFGAMGTYGPDIAHSVGWNSAAAAGGLVSTTLVIVLATQLFGRRLRIRRSLPAGCLLGAIGWALLYSALLSESGVLAVAGAAILGLGGGLALLSSAALIGVIAPAHRRAEIQAAYFAVAFIAVATSSLGLGPVIAATSLGRAVALAFLADVLLGIATVLLLRHTIIPGESDASHRR